MTSEKERISEAFNALKNTFTFELGVNESNWNGYIRWIISYVLRKHAEEISPSNGKTSPDEETRDAFEDGVKAMAFSINRNPKKLFEKSSRFVKIFCDNNQKKWIVIPISFQKNFDDLYIWFCEEKLNIYLFSELGNHAFRGISTNEEIKFVLPEESEKHLLDKLKESLPIYPNLMLIEENYEPLNGWNGNSEKKLITCESECSERWKKKYHTTVFNNFLFKIYRKSEGFEKDYELKTLDYNTVSSGYLKDEKGNYNLKFFIPFCFHDIRTDGKESFYDSVWVLSLKEDCWGNTYYKKGLVITPEEAEEARLLGGGIRISRCTVYDQVYNDSNLTLFPTNI